MTSHELARKLLEGADIQRVVVEVAGLQIEVVGLAGDGENQVISIMTDVDDLWDEFEDKHDCGFSNCSMFGCPMVGKQHSSSVKKTRMHNKVRDGG